MGLPCRCPRGGATTKISRISLMQTSDTAPFARRIRIAEREPGLQTRTPTNLVPSVCFVAIPTGSGGSPLSATSTLRSRRMSTLSGQGVVIEKIQKFEFPATVSNFPPPAQQACYSSQFSQNCRTVRSYGI